MLLTVYYLKIFEKHDIEVSITAWFSHAMPLKPKIHLSFTLAVIFEPTCANARWTIAERIVPLIFDTSRIVINILCIARILNISCY